MGVWGVGDPVGTVGMRVALAFATLALASAAGTDDATVVIDWSSGTQSNDTMELARTQTLRFVWQTGANATSVNATTTGAATTSGSTTTARSAATESAISAATTRDETTMPSGTVSEGDRTVNNANSTVPNSPPRPTTTPTARVSQLSSGTNTGETTQPSSSSVPPTSKGARGRRTVVRNVVGAEVINGER